MLITPPRWCRSTYCSAAAICANPVAPSISAVGVSTSTMLAAGASACDQSTSSVASITLVSRSWPPPGGTGRPA